MAAPKVFLVHLRRPCQSNPKEQRDDPFYEFGSFGCTRCHSRNLLHPRHAKELEGARLAFIQGGPEGSRLVLLTPRVQLIEWADCCEVRWRPVQKPFKYSAAPIITCNDGRGHFPLAEAFARATRCPTVESGLSSRFRSRTRPLPPELAKEIIAVYGRRRANAPRTAFASTYDDALPYAPPRIDRMREATYRRRIKELARARTADTKTSNSAGSPAAARTRSRCRLSQRGLSKSRTSHCS